MSPSASSAQRAARSARRNRVSQRTCNACVRCRRQKIKCSGSQPCEACKKRNLACELDERDQKVLVTKGFISDLQEQARHRSRDNPVFQQDDDEPVLPATDHQRSQLLWPRIARRNERRRRGTDANALVSPRRPEEDESRATESADESRASLARLDPVAAQLKNPLTAGQASFMKSSDGHAFHLGSSSNWSFTRRVLNMAHEYVHHSPVAPDHLLFDGQTYNLPWDGSRVSVPSDVPVLPSLDHALFLINAVKFHCAQPFHMFDEDSFMESLYAFYADPEPQIASGSLFYVHLLLVMAFGKSVGGQSSRHGKPPGCDFFVKALQLLPDVHVLCRFPIISAEILCCIALYYQSLDFRHCAHNFMWIGQALRLALNNGMHLNMPIEQLGLPHVERCRRIFWTIYVLDREMTSLMGLPHSINDDDVRAELPSFGGSMQRVSALRMQIKLSHTIASIGREVYGVDGRLNKNFLSSTRSVLATLAGQADELRETFPLPLEKGSVQGISRISAYLHSLYHQCIVLATRPLLICFQRIRCESPEAYPGMIESSATVANLIKLCVESSQQMIGILACLEGQALLEKFLPHDLETLFVATVNLILGPWLDPSLREASQPWLVKAYELFSEITQSGNLVARLRWSELQQLAAILGVAWPSQGQPPFAPSSSDGLHLEVNQGTDSPNPATGLNVRQSGPERACGMDPNDASNNALASPSMGHMDEQDLWEGGLTAEQMLDLANSIGHTETEWMHHAMTEHSIW